MTKLDLLIRWQSRSLGASIFTLGILMGFNIPASAQITYEGGKAATETTKDNFTIPINEGIPTDGNKNLFHSFGKFGVPTDGSANFEANSSIQNIFGRVTGGTPSLVDGKLQVTGGTANLFLMNPAGIVFGAKASLDINGAFTATTANAIEFGNSKWFNAFGTNTYSELTGNPIGLAFGSGVPGSIFSAATFDATDTDPTKHTTKPGQSITLVGGTVISTGDIKTAGGNISIATVEGGKYVQIKVEGNILGLNLPTSLPTYLNSINSAPPNFTPQSLAELLTNTKVDLAATGVKNEKGVVTLVGNPAAIKAAEDRDKALAARASNPFASDVEAAYNASEKALDAATAVGDPTTIANDINLGDTVSKQNRSISSGDVITRNLETSAVNNGGNIHIESSQSILSGNISTNAKNSLVKPDTFLSGTVVLNAQTELKAKEIDTSYAGNLAITDGNVKDIPGIYKGGNVILSTQTKDIIVDSINTKVADKVLELSKDNSKRFRGGDVTINSIGLFRVIQQKERSIISSLFGVIKIDHGSKKPFASGVTFEPNQDGEKAIPKPDFSFPDGASGTRGAITSSVNNNGSLATVYKDQSINGISITGNNTPVTPTINNDPNKNPGAGKPGTEVATNKSGNNSEKQDPKDNSPTSSDNQASKPGDSEEDKEKAKKRKQKAKCKNNSSAIASAKLGTDPTRSGNSVDSAAEEFCPPNIDNGILQILTDRN